MANMRLIEAKTVGSGGVAFVTFSAIPQTYTDLKILASSRDNRAGQINDDIAIQVGYNGAINTGSIYTYYRAYGTGSGVGSDNSSGTALYGGFSTGSTATASVFGNNSIYFANYTSNNNKTVSFDGVSENNATDSWQVLNAGLIATSNPITDIKLFGADASLLSEHTTFYLYGISSTIASGAKAYGGYVTEDANYFYHTFLASGTFTPTTALTADYLVIAGGGGGGRYYAGAGGAGGLRSTVGATGGGGSLESALSLTANTSYSVTVGAGGVASTGLTGGNGNNSVFSTITSTGGGGGGGANGGSNTPGQTGGSGGGGNRDASTAGGAGTANQGYAGGTGATGVLFAGGGGGAGEAGNTDGNGYGGDGVTIPAFANATQTGVNTYYAGGGGGGANGAGGIAGEGGGGTGGGNSLQAIAGTANTGGGGGGGATASPYEGAAGGSGLVIIRYAK